MLLRARASLLVTKGIATRSKDATRGTPGLATRKKKLLGAMALHPGSVLTTSYHCLLLTLKKNEEEQGRTRK